MLWFLYTCFKFKVWLWIWFKMFIHLFLFKQSIRSILKLFTLLLIPFIRYVFSHFYYSLNSYFYILSIYLLISQITNPCQLIQLLLVPFSRNFIIFSIAFRNSDYYKTLLFYYLSSFILFRFSLNRINTYLFNFFLIDTPSWYSFIRI